MNIHEYTEDWSKEQQLQWIRETNKLQREKPLLALFLKKIDYLLEDLDSLIYLTWKKRKGGEE